jgi:hypothetical protein
VSGCTDLTNDNNYASACKVTFTLTETLQAPIYVYYGLKGFYQNHRRYLKYFSPDQLSEGDADASSVAINKFRQVLIAVITIPIHKLLDQQPNR